MGYSPNTPRRSAQPNLNANQMATKEASSEMTGEAYDLLDCFVSGIDDLVYEIAEQMAASNGHTNSEGIVRITREDVKAAANAVFTAIKAEAGKTIPAAVAAQVEAMHECVMAKCHVEK